MDDEFYVGYLDRSPPGLRRWARRVVSTVAVLVAGLTALVASRLQPAEPGEFEFGVQTPFEGVLFETPLPILRTETPEGPPIHRLLVGPGKHGLPEFARGHHGERVRFAGTRIHVGRSEMIEMNAPESFLSLGPATNAPTASTVVGDVELTGELVDTKCWFGVMRPALGKVHRACAVRCLSGGVPPGLLLRDDAGNAVTVLLTGPGGAPLKFDVRWAARTLRAIGRLGVEGEVPRLEVSELVPVDP
jgi:hypothetical protein